MSNLQGTSHESAPDVARVNLRFPPWWPSPGPTIPIFDYLSRNAGVSAGDLHGKIFRELRRNHDAAGGDPQRVIMNDLDQLRVREFLGRGDYDRLTHLVKIVTSKLPAGDMLLPVRRIHVELLDDDGSSPFALAIASVAMDSILTAMEAKESNPVVGADVGGVIGGVIFGGLLGAVVCGALASYGASQT